MSTPARTMDLAGRAGAPETNPRTIVFVPLAQLQTPFYVGVARHLRARGHRIVFASLHEPSLPMIEEAGFRALNFYDYVQPLEGYLAERALEVAERFGFENVNRAISHEKWFYGISDSGHLTAKLAAYAEGMDAVLSSVIRDYPGPVALVQELGGFLGVLGGFHAARRRAVDTAFIEPSFFRGRVFFVKNSLGTPRITAALREPTAELRRYIDETLRDRKIVIPVKDARLYRSAVGKVFNRRNLRRLVEKTLQKHVRSHREEFSHIRNYVVRHLEMVVNNWRLGPYYRELPSRPFVYYPLHVPADVALTLRSPEYLDQFGLLDYLARNVPATHVLVVKEHPALVGAFSPARIIDLTRRYDNVVLLRPTINNLDVIERAAAVVTVNSKSGAEALLLNRPVVVLGDAFYRTSGLVHAVPSLQDAPDALRAAVQQQPHPPEKIERYFQAVWDSSHPGELYHADDQNCRTFAISLAAFLCGRELGAATW